ncbi:MAG: hypothetical protein ACXWLM_12280 [Myxococcales bacterium]
MKRYNGGTRVEGGYYFSEKSWEITTISGKEGVLPGAADERYIHAPLLALFVLAPVMGLGFAMFLPFIGFALPFYALGKKLMGAGRKAAEDVAATMTPGWQPGEAYLAGKPGEKAAKEERHLEKLEKEIEEKRAH